MEVTDLIQMYTFNLPPPSVSRLALNSSLSSAPLLMTCISFHPTTSTSSSNKDIPHKWLLPAGPWPISPQGHHLCSAIITLRSEHTRIQGSQRGQAEHMKPTRIKKKASNVPGIPRGGYKVLGQM